MVKEKGLEQIGSAEEFEKIVKDIVAKHPDEVAQYKAGSKEFLDSLLDLP